MKRLLLLAFFLPLAGCTQRAELSSPSGTPFSGPVTLRYQFGNQAASDFRVSADGKTTVSYAQAAPTPGNPPRNVVHGEFNTEMLVHQEAAAQTVAASSTGPSEPNAAPAPSDQNA